MKPPASAIIPPRDPRPEDERRCVDSLRDDVGVDENSRADDAAHHGHGGAEEPELAGELSVFVRHGRGNDEMPNDE